MHDVVQRNHLAGVGLKVVRANVLRARTELLIRLHVHAVRPVVEIEIVHVHRTHEHLKSIGNLAQRHLQALGLFAVDPHQILRVVGGEAGEKSRDLSALIALAHQLVGRIRNGLQGVASQVLQLIREPSESAQTLHRGRVKRHDESARNAQQWTANSVQDGERRMFFSLAVAERFQIHEDHPSIGSVAGKTKPHDSESAVDLGYMVKDFLRLGRDIARVLQGSALGSLHYQHQIALIIFWNKGLGKGAIQPEGQSHGYRESQ